MTEMTATEYLDMQGLSNCCLGAAEALKDSFQLKSTVGYLQLMAQYYERVARAKEDGKYVVAHTAFLSPDIYYAMDMIPSQIEMTTTFLGFFQDPQPFLGLAAEHGIPPEVCSMHRVTDAMCVAGTYPRPDAFVYSNLTCDNTPKGGETMAEIYKVPAYFLERPYTLTSPHSRLYWRQEVENLINFLEKLAGRKMDYNRLKETLRLSYQATQLCEEINELRKATPSPLPAEAAYIPVAVTACLGGTPEAVHYLGQLRDELKDRVAKGIGAVPQERFRVIYTFVYPVWDMELIGLMEQRYGAVLVADMFQSWKSKGEWLTDPSDPIGNIALRYELAPGIQQCQGPMEDYVDDVVRMAREYRADGAVCFAHIGCRQTSSSIRAYKDELERELGVPTVIIPCDILDKSFTNRGEVLNKLDGFFEMIEDSKKYQMRRKAA